MSQKNKFKHPPSLIVFIDTTYLLKIVHTFLSLITSNQYPFLVVQPADFTLEKMNKYKI